jgi:hypothetical protein
LSGRGLFVVAFWTVRVTGCWSTEICAPADGDIGAGAVMLTPGIGPATEGLNGFELLLDWQAATSTAATTATTGVQALRNMDSPLQGLVCPQTYRVVAQTRANVYIGSKIRSV